MDNRLPESLIASNAGHAAKAQGTIIAIALELRGMGLLLQLSNDDVAMLLRGNRASFPCQQALSVAVKLEHPKLMLAESKQMTETLRKIYKASSDFIGDASLSAEQQVALKTRSLSLPPLADNLWEPSIDEDDLIRANTHV